MGRYGAGGDRTTRYGRGYRGSTLKGDPRYTNTTVFQTFPWPQRDDVTRERVAAAAQRIVVERRKACAGERGLTAVYNLVDQGGYRDPADAHRELDAAVAGEAVRALRAAAPCDGDARRDGAAGRTVRERRLGT